MSIPNNTSIEKLSIGECKKILSKNGKEYSDNEIISIRDLLYCLAQIDIDTYYHMQKKEKEDAAFEAEKKEEKSHLKEAVSFKKENKKLRNAA